MACLYLNDCSCIIFSEFVSGQTFRSTTYDRDTAHTIISFLEEVFSVAENVHSKIPEDLPAFQSVLCCHLCLAGAIVASMVIKVQNTWLERALPWLQCSAGARECQKISLLQNEVLFV